MSWSPFSSYGMSKGKAPIRVPSDELQRTLIPDVQELSKCCSDEKCKDHFASPPPCPKPPPGVDHYPNGKATQTACDAWKLVDLVNKARNKLKHFTADGNNETVARPKSMIRSVSDSDSPVPSPRREPRGIQRLVEQQTEGAPEEVDVGTQTLPSYAWQLTAMADNAKKKLKHVNVDATSGSPIGPKIALFQNASATPTENVNPVPSPRRGRPTFASASGKYQTKPHLPFPEGRRKESEVLALADEQRAKAPEAIDISRHFTVLGEYMNNLRERGDLCDVLIRIDDQTFPSHRVVLSYSSEYFNNVLSIGNKTVSVPMEIKLKGVIKSPFEAYLGYAYTGQLDVTAENIGLLTTTAEFLRANSMKRKCTSYLDNISLEQALLILVKGSVAMGSNIYKRSKATVVEYFCYAVDYDTFLHLDVATLARIVNSDRLYIASEMEVFTAIMQWINFDYKLRKNHFSGMMNKVRFGLMTQLELLQCAEMTPLFRDCPDVLHKANWLVTLRQMEHADSLGVPVPSPRACISSNVEANSDGVNKKTMDDEDDDLDMEFETNVENTETEAEESQATQEIEPQIVEVEIPTTEPQPRTPTIEPVTPAPRIPEEIEARPQPAARTPPTPASPIKMPDILAVGAFQKDSEVKEVQRYSFAENQWNHYAVLPDVCYQPAATLLNGKLYLVGGRDIKKKKVVPISNTYVFDTQMKIWKKLPNLNTPRMFHSLCSMYSMLYAIGGQDDKGRALKSIECYNPHSNRWLQVKPMTVARLGASAAVHDGRLFVIGGCGDSTDKKAGITILGDVEIFDPRYNSMISRKPLVVPRCNANLVSAERNLYLCGGATRGPKNILTSLGSLDIYSATIDSWTHLADMKTPRHNAGVVTMGAKILIIGGNSSDNNRPLTSVECYDIENNTWEEDVKDLPAPAKWLSCISTQLMK